MATHWHSIFFVDTVCTGIAIAVSGTAASAAAVVSGYVAATTAGMLL